MPDCCWATSPNEPTMFEQMALTLYCALLFPTALWMVPCACCAKAGAAAAKAMANMAANNITFLNFVTSCSTNTYAKHFRTRTL